MPKPKPFTRPQKKQKPKPPPETADDFQEAADREEEAGGKHRIGDPSKSARAFVRALEIYDKALDKYPSNFDLAYNKARLQFEITQQPGLVEHIGLPLVDLLRQTLESHRVALGLEGENADILFNTSQVLTSLAEQLSEQGQADQAVPLLQEGLELLSACLSRQEMLLEQQTLDLEDLEDGGVELEPGEKLASSSSAAGSDLSEQTASIETPVTATDLLDTVHASLSALTTLIPLVDQQALQTYGDMAQALTEKRTPNYISLLPAETQTSAQTAIAIDRTIFIAAFADAQYNFHMIELSTYLDRLRSFEIPAKGTNLHALCTEAEARTEFALSALDRFHESPDLPAEVCWTQLTLAQDLYSQAAKLDPENGAKERRSEIYESKGSLELLRHRLSTSPDVNLPHSVTNSGQTLIANAQKYYKAAAQLARNENDGELEEKAKERWLIASEVGAALYGLETEGMVPPFDGNSAAARGRLAVALEECADEGLVDGELVSVIQERIMI